VRHAVANWAASAATAVKDTDELCEKVFSDGI